MSASTPEAVHEVLTGAFRRGDLDAYIALHEDDAVLVMPPDGMVVRGREDIRGAAAPMLAAAPRLSSVVHRKLETGGLALTQARWEFDGTAPDGSPLRLSGRGIIVSRRRPDGTWGIVLDDPLSAA
jgi:ketosteroid isomerase-like protein